MIIKGLIPAFCSGETLRTQIEDRIARSREDSFDIWWLGQSGFLVQWNKQCLLFDPYLSDSLTKKYSGTEKPHVRMRELVIQPYLLDKINIVSSSHNHTDHLDAETLQPLLKANPNLKFLIPEANRSFVCERVGCSFDFPLGLNDGDNLKIGPFEFFGVPAAHNTIERDDKGRCKFMGFVVKFGKWTIYHSGDTLLYDGMAATLAPFQVDVAFLPINGNDPSRGVAGNLNCSEAAGLGKAIDARLVIPHHYHMFEFNTAEPADFAKAADAIQQPYKILRLGETMSIS
ncbi:MAG: MBL fold metallo-hydrolase [Chryseolinea sp.]